MPYHLYVFGSNGEGQLGIPAADIVQTPTVAQSWPPEKHIVAVCGGDNHTLILSSTGTVHYSGDAQKGQLGSVEYGRTRYEYFKESDDTNVLLFAATCESSSFIRERFGDHKGTSVRTQGTGHWGEGNVSLEGVHKGFSSRSLPHPAVDFAAGGWHYVVILSNGDIWGWGKSRLDQLGPKLSTQQSVTEQTLIEEDIPFIPVKVVCGKEFTYLASDPSSGEHYLLGRDKFSIRSSMPSQIKGWKQIGATWHAIFVLFEDGSVAAWGKDNMWKLVPDELPPIEQMAVGSEHVLALTRDEKLISWGWGKHGNCGDLTKLKDKLKNDMVSGFWNDIDIPGTIKFVGAGFCTSFVLTEVTEETN